MRIDYRSRSYIGENTSMKKVLSFCMILLTGITGKSQDTTWQTNNINASECSFSMPAGAERRDTAIFKDGYKFDVKICQYNSGGFVIQSIATAMYKPGEDIQDKDEGLRGYKTGVEKKASASGMYVYFKDTTLSGMKCVKSVMKSRLLTIYMYGVLHNRFLYAFTGTLLENSPENRSAIKRFLGSIRFSKEEEKPVKSSAYEIGFLIGNILGYGMIIAAIAALFIYLFKKRK